MTCLGNCCQFEEGFLNWDQISLNIAKNSHFDYNDPALILSTTVQLHNSHLFQKCCHFHWNQNKVNTFERNDDCATVFLKWTDFTLQFHKIFSKIEAMWKISRGLLHYWKLDYLLRRIIFWAFRSAQCALHTWSWLKSIFKYKNYTSLNRGVMKFQIWSDKNLGPMVVTTVHRKIEGAIMTK